MGGRGYRDGMTAHFNYVGYTVRDMPSTLAFYRLIGLDIPAEADTEDHVEHVAPGGVRLAWDTVELIASLDPDWREPTGHRGTPGFVVDEAAEVDAVYQRLVAAGYQPKAAPYDAFWGQRYASIIDPDGVLVDVFAWLPGSGPDAP